MSTPADWFGRCCECGAPSGAPCSVHPDTVDDERPLHGYCKTRGLPRKCSDGYVFAEFEISGGKRYMRVRCGCNPEPEVARSSRQSPRFNTRRINRQFELDYREDLSRGPGDPEAYVSSPAQLQKLIDKRKRQGWRVGERSLEDALAPPPTPKTGEEIARAAYEAARDKNFTPEVVSG